VPVPPERAPEFSSLLPSQLHGVVASPQAPGAPLPAGGLVAKKTLFREEPLPGCVASSAACVVVGDDLRVVQLDLSSGFGTSP